jgi:HAMP domain-containing protein
MVVIQRIVGLVLGLLFLAAVIVFTSLILAALLALGLVAWGWLWWRTRALRRAGRGGVVIEGEYRDVTPAQRIEDRDRP